jgi:hypothetical protein
MRFSITLALGLAVAGCSGANNERTQPAESGDTARPQPEMRAAEGGNADTVGATDIPIQGVVRIVGNDPSPQVVLSVVEGASTAQIALVGDLRDELGRLSGVEVAVDGDSVANPQGMPARAIDVRYYDVLSVNSEPAYLGILENRDGVWWLDREESLRLAALPSDLEARDGAKVWIAGPLEGDELRVQSYGIVRER